MGAVVPFKSASNRTSALVTTTHLDRDDVVVVILLVAGWLTMSVWLLGSIARSVVA